VGIDVEYVTIDPVCVNGQRCEGFCAFSDRVNQDLVNDPDTWLDRFVKAMLAGEMSDKLLLGDEIPQDIRGSWAGDSNTMMDRVRDLRQFSSWPECKKWLDGMREEVRQILSDPKTEAGVIAVAALLLRHRRVTGEHVRTVFLQFSTDRKTGT
jgi:hypothetical protein